MSEEKNHQERVCWSCKRELNFDDFYKTNWERFNKKLAFRLWQNPKLEFFCCKCFGKVKAQEYSKEVIKEIESSIIYPKSIRYERIISKKELSNLKIIPNEISFLAPYYLCIFMNRGDNIEATLYPLQQNNIKKITLRYRGCIVKKLIPNVQFDEISIMRDGLAIPLPEILERDNKEVILPLCMNYGSYCIYEAYFSISNNKYIDDIKDYISSIVNGIDIIIKNIE